MNLSENIKICNELGEEKEFKLLFSFDYKKNGKKYIVYTDIEDNKYNIFCSLYKDENDGLCFVEEVDDSEVLELVDKYIEEYRENFEDDGSVLYDFEVSEDF